MPSRRLKRLCLATLLFASRADADASISVLAGYGSEIRRAERQGATSYGVGIGARVEHVFDAGLSLGASVTFHRGSEDLAQDPSARSTYRAVRHASYVGPEVGWRLPIRHVLLRPYVGGGAWYVVNRVAVRDRELRDDGLLAFVMPGVLVAFQARDWYGGLDLRLPIAFTLPLADAAPTVMVAAGFSL